jgi:hypothetical protein
MYHIERENQLKRKFLATGDIELPGSAAVLQYSKDKGRKKMKASQLDRNMLPRREVIEAYKSVGQGYDLTVQESLGAVDSISSIRCL